MRPKSIVLLMLALACGVVASIGITQVMGKRGADPVQAQFEPVVVAAADIPLGDPVSPQLVKIEAWPKDKVPKGALRSLEELENRRPKSRIFAGSPIMDNQLLGKGVLDQGASDSIPKGMRVIAVKVDMVSGNASLIRPGDRVDVLVHLQSGGDLQKTVTKTILQDIKVFAVDKAWEAATASGEKTVVAKTISLLVTPAQAEKVTLASEMGNIRLVMRSPDDKEQAKVSGAIAMDVLHGSGGSGGMDRMLESLLPAVQSVKSSPGAVSGLMGLLGGSKKSQPPPDNAAPDATKTKKTEVFAIRILSESQPMETVLELIGDGKAAASESSFLHWKPTASAAARAPQSAAPPSAKPATPSPPQEPQGEPDASDEPEAESQQNSSTDD